MGVIKAAIGDAVLTFMWVFSAATLGVGTSILAALLGLVHPMALLSVTTVLFFMLLFVFGIISDVLGGASFNPTGIASFYAAGLGDDSLISAAVRFPAQAAGAVGGAIAILEVIPPHYKHMIVGPSLKVDVHTGAIAEGVLTFIMSFIVFLVIVKGPKNSFVKNWLLTIPTVVLVVAGSRYTGPSMNPANAFGWAYINNWHNTWEQFYVYWICPFVGAILAAWMFRAIFPPPSAKPKKQPKAKKN